MADRRPEPSKTLARHKTLVTPRRVTVVDVAREAGVSPMTVSNVVNGHHRLMSEAPRTLVEAAIERLGYRPPVNGRSMGSTRRLRPEARPGGKGWVSMCRTRWAPEHN